MLHAARKYQKSALYALAAILILGLGFSTFAQFSDNAYVVRTVHIFPSEISSNGWQNAETLTFQNLDEYALLQDFNAINSATLSKSLRVVPPAGTEAEEQTSDTSVDEVNTPSNQTGSVTDSETQSTATGTNSTDQGSPTDNSSASDAGDSIEASATTTAPAADEQEVVPEPDVTQDETEATETQPASPAEAEEEVGEPQDAEPETGTTTVLREVRSLFAYAIETLTETFSSTSPPADEVPAESQLEADTDEVTQEADVTFGFVNDDVAEAESSETQTVTSTEPVAPVVPDTAATETPLTTVPTTTEEAASSPDSAATTSSTTDQLTDEAATSTNEATPGVTEFDLPDTAASTTAVSDCGADCTGHVLRLANFGYPLDEGVEISGAQLRVSFAAKHKQIRETLPFFTMNYSFDDGATWSTGGSVVIDDEVSNSINGGYFLFALPAIDDSVSLADLQVELRYDDDPALLSDLFVESAWLELFVLEPPAEPTTPEFERLLADDGFIDTKLSGDRLVVSDTEVIDFDFTDENTNETLIIKSSKKTYDGLSQTTTHFSVTNTSDQSDDFTVQTYFPQNMGEVTDLAVFNLNKPRNTIVPEYRPYIYHCEAGWDVSDTAASVPVTLADLSIETASGTPEQVATTSTSTTASSETTTTTSQAGTTDPEQSTVVADEESPEPSYTCGATSVVRSCDALEGDGTACSVTQKVRDHEVVQYTRGWEDVSTNEGEMSRGGVLKRAASFLGFGPDRKDVPESFEGRVHTDGTFSIAPGETKYFKMDISYPAFSAGEYWIEVIGDEEYGLLDPFWSSLWRYRKPITIDNTSGAELIEQQFFLELTSADSDFWTNVQSDGGDIRFVSETPGNDLTWWDTNWENRVQITIPAASVDEDLTDFPVFVDLNTLGSDFFTDVASDGRDIRVLDDAGVPNEYAYDLVAIDTGLETGELHFKATTLSSSTDNVFYLYFNNPSASAYAAGDTYGSEAVWSNSFDVRYALDDNPASSGLQLDSTSNGNDATSYPGMTSGDVVTGQIGEAINHDGNDGAVFGTSLPYAGEFTASMWWRSSGDGFAISRDVGATTKFGTWTGGNMFTRVVSGSDTSLAAPADGAWAHVVLTRDSANKIDVYLDGVPTRLFGDGAQAGLSDWENMGGQTSQGFQGELDELRFASVKRSDGWVSTEFANQDDPGTFYNAATVESLVFSSFVELDHWVQHFDSTTQEADIWVQVDRIDAAASTTIQLYYGNATAESESDEYAPFTYSTTTDLYYVVNDSQTSDIIVYSLIDNNEVSIDGGTPVTLQSGETTSITSANYSSSSVISALGPITARSTDDASEPPVPISFATTTHITTTNRNDEDFYVYAPFATTDVRVFQGANVTETASSSVAVNTAATYNVNLGGSDAGIIESDEPILLYHNNDTDSYVAYPPTLRDLYGVHSNDYYYSSIAGGASVEIYCSSGVSGTTTGMTRGGLEGGDDFCTQGANGTGPGVRLTNQTAPMGATQQADSDGNESSRFLPTPEFGTRYILPVGADYATIVCAPRFGVVNLEMQTAGGATLNAGTCTPSGESPGVLNFTAAYSQGTQVVSTNNVPFYVYYEEDGSGTADEDETNTWSAVQAKKFNSLYVSFTVGAQEVNTDAQYEQNNFRWYDNTNGATPGVAWPAADGATVAEGEAIADGGAVNPGDVLRLRMNLLANNGTGTIESTAFELQYAEAQTCSAVVDTAWVPVAQIGSTTPAFAGSDNAAVADGSTLPSSLLSDSDVLATYEEQNVSAFIPNQVDNGQAVEFDWVIEVVAPEVNSQYCFRMVRASTGGLASYATYPQLLTAGPPGQSALLTPFNNEHAISTLPNFTFVAADVGGDALDYEIEIATDVAFSSIVESADSDANPFDFENVTLASDKAPFNNGQVVRYLITSALTNGQTYWWRVRAIDTDGSNTYGDYSTPRSFTVNTAVTVSEWFQTTDEQFDTNSLIGVRTSGSDSVELDIAGSNLVGEYGTLDVNNGATTSVSFVNSYTNPVVVASIRFAKSVPNGDQPAARVSSKTGSGFDVYADNYTFDAPGTSTIDWVVMEAGEWIIDDGAGGKLVFATSTSVSAIAGSGVPTDPGGLDITFPTSFGAAPSVFTMVTTANDPQWVVSSVYDGNNKNNPPTASLVSVYLNDNLASDGHGSAEDIDLIAFDPGDGTNNGVVFDVLNTATDVTHIPVTEPFAATFASTPPVILVQQLTMVGGQGSYAMIDIDTPPTATNVTIAAEEGGTTGPRDHAAEQMSVMAFQDAVGDIVRTSNGQFTSSVIDYDDVVIGNAWGEVSWNDSGDVTYRVQYNTGSGFQDIPDSALSGNAAGFTTSPINILNLDTDIYNQIRLVAEFSGVAPELFDWTVTWGQRVEVPELGDPYDNEKTADTTPTFDFTTTDPQGDALDYEISYSTDPTFESSSTTIRSDVDFTDFNGGTAGPYASGATVTYTIPGGSALTNGETYWWRVRAKDPAGGDSYSPWSEPDNFTVDTATSISTWFQTTQAQFQEGVIDGVVASTSNSVELSNEIAEYGTVTLTDNDWTTINTELTYNNMVVVASPSYNYDEALDNGRTPQVRNKTRTSFEMKVENATLSLNATTSVQYMVMEAGDWIIEDGGAGTRFVAGTAENVSATEGSNAGYGGGTVVDFVPDFSAPPVVFGTVSSNNGNKWVATVLDDGTQTGEVPAADMDVALGVGYDTDTVRAAEDIDYIAVDVSTGDNNGSLFDSLNSPQAVTSNDVAVSFNQTFATLPGLILTHNNATEGGDGGFSQVDTGTAGDATQVYLSVAEIPANAGHAAEVVSVLAFESASGIILRDESVGGGLAGTIASEPVLFTDGLGPKFGQALINATTPGASSVVVQFEYLTPGGDFELIPDVELAGNSTGYTSSAIDMTAIDVGTYQTIRLLATLSCDGVDCPTLDDWAVEWSEGVEMSGTLQEYDRITNVANATVTVSVNGGPAIRTGTVTAGVWSISGVTAFVGDTVTVFVDGLLDGDVPEDEEAVAVFVYDGLGDMTGVELFEGHLSISSDELTPVTVADIARSDNSSLSGNDEDLFIDVDGSGNLAVCGVGSCTNANLYVGPNNTFTIATTSGVTVAAHDMVNDGTVEFGTNTMEVSGSWFNNATTTMGASTVVLTATTSTETLSDADGSLNFNNLTFGQTSGAATWTPQDPLDVNGILSVAYGTLDRDGQPITVARALTTGAAGFWTGVGTTTFDGAGSAAWTDANPSPQDIGNAVIDGTSRIVVIGSDVRARSILIGANDRLNAGGSNDIFISGNFTNTNIFNAQSSQIVVDGPATNAVITTNGSNLSSFRASSTAGSVAFTESGVTLLGNFSIATGTVTLPTDVLNISGSFTNEGGVFAHNNAEVNFTGVGTKTITLLGSTFLNAFYDVRFSGAGDWTFLDAAATTTNTWTQTNGSVTLPSGTLTVGRNYSTTGSGSFNANGGEVVFLARSADTITTNGSEFYDVRIKEGSPVRGGGFDAAWLYRDAITINAASIDDDLTDFPVYLDLADFGTDFFANINADGGDIRVTQGDGVTEVPREIVAVDTGAETGEMYFKAPTLASSTNTTFYIYYGNSGASDYAIDTALGAENVWDDDFLAVYHMSEDAPLDSTSFDRDTAYVGTSPAVVSGGQVGSAVRLIDDGGNDYIDLQSDLSELDGASEVTISGWVNMTDDGSDDSVFTRELANGTPILIWDNIGGTTNNDTYTFSVGNTGTGNRVDAAPDGISVGGTWQYVTAAMQGGNRYIYVDGVLRNTTTGAVATIPVNTSGSAIGYWNSGTNWDADGLFDEFRISAIERPAEWIEAEFTNMDNPSSFYTVTSGVGAQTRTFADTNATISNDLVIESARAQFPTGNLFIGGSFDNNSEFTNSNGTVVFNATSTGNTVAASSSLFYDLTFDGVGGGWNVTENATATNAIELSNGDDFTVDSGVTLESTGTFFTQLSNASTTWTGSTLRLSGTDHEINDKAGDGDDFATISVVGDVDIRMWNSTAATYDTQDTGSIYSQDHAGVDGDLYIYGDYERLAGTEYWNYATDFDGTDLTGGSERQANVRIVNGGRVAVTGAALEMLGTAAASTTVNAQSGSYSWLVDEADVSGQYFTAGGGDAAGLQLIGSSTMSTFANAEFTIPTASAAITLGSTTIDTNPAAQYFNVDFVSGGGSTNVNLLGTPSSFWWFRDGAGDRYGEAFDNGDADPGDVRWDDSNYQINISGTVYSPDQVTPLGGPVCDGSTANVRVVVDGGAYTDAVSCDGVTGAYNFTNVSYAGDPVLHIYLDTAGGTKGAVVTQTPIADIADMDIYANHTIVRHELSAPMTIADMAAYDASDDSDLPFTAATNTPALITTSDTALYVWPNKTFVPGGEITLQANATGNAYDGTLSLGANATFTGSSTTTYTLGGSLLAAAGASLDTASSTFVFNATTTGKVINSSSTIAFNEVQFTGAGGAWSLDSNVTAADDVTVAAGTLQGTGDMTLLQGELTGGGSVDMTGGTIKIDRANTLGGINPWSFNNLILGNGAVAGVTTPASNATTTVRGVFTINAAHFYDAGSSVLNLAGDGTVFVETGQFLEDTSTVQYSGASPSVLATAYYNLIVDDAVTSVVAVAPPTGLQVLNNLTIGELGTASLNLTTNDPLTSVAGDLSIGSGGTLIGSDTNNLQVFGDWSNNGTYTANGGTVVFNSPDTATISAGVSPFATMQFIGTGPYTMLANATATVEFNLGATTDYTQQSGTTLAVGGEFINQTNGVDTVWTGTTLALYGGQAYEINVKTQTDDYETITVAANTHPRLWNSSAVSVTTAPNGSLYMMDHDDVAGDLYIYGDYVNTSFTDSWSAGVDWDGGVVTPRQANVYVEGGGSVSYTGGGLNVLGSSTASTTVQNFGAGTYDLTIGGTASFSWRYVVPRDLGTAGIEFTGTPTVTDFSFLDLLVEANGASAVTVAGSVIDANPAKTFTNDYFNSDTGVTGAVNVTATGASVSSWRFTNGFGNLEGEAFDADGGDPGEIVWEDSAQEVTIAGNVYSDEGSITSGVCNGVTNNIVLRVAGLTTYSGSCDGTTGAYSIPSVAFSANDTMTLYIDGEAVQAANVSIDPVSNINNFDLYEDRVIVRHEGANPITIADMAVWDSSDDADIPFTAAAGVLTLPADTKLIVWDSKTFEPEGDVTVGDSIELFANAQYVAANTETHSVGASLIAGAGSVISAAESEFVFTSAVGGQTIDINEAQLHTVSFTGAGAWTITDPTFTAGDDVSISAGAVTLPTGTTTVAGSFNTTGGSFDANSGLLLFTATDGGNTIAFGGSDANEVRFNGIGSWSFTDTNATTSGSFTVATGTVTLPSGTLAVGEDFVVTDTIAHAGGTVLVTGVSGANVVTLSGNDLTNLVISAPAGDYTLTDVSAALLGDLTLTGGSLAVGTGTVSIGGSFDVSGGTYANGTGTLLFNSTDGGEFIDPGANDLYNVVIAGTGGWTLVDNATTTNNFTLTNAGTFTVTSGTQLYVGGVFTNNVGGPATTWTGTTLVLDGGNEYETNIKTTSFESYENLILGENTDISSWRSTAASVIVPGTSSWYSQDHGATDGALNIYGDYHIGTTTEYWSANTDFDGAALGSPRTATVSIADGSTVTVDGGSLQIIGAPANITTIQNQGAGLYTFAASAGSLNASNYDFSDLDADGLQLSGSISVPSLSNGYFTQAANGSNLITLVAGVVNNNASLLITDTGFATGGFTGGANVTLDATTTNSWNFTGEIGDFWGEDFDVDGFDACSSIRWDDSECLLTEQTNYRWRNDDGGEGAPAGTWYDADWSERQRLRVINDDAFAYASTAIKMTVPYDADMQTDFEDLRFTDSDGVTLINHWIEKVTVSDNAIVWIQVPTLAADSVSEVYMYYGNVVAADSSDGSAVFATFEDFEDNNITEYAGTPGDLALFSTNSTFAYGGGFGLDTDGNESGRTTNGITRTDITAQQGQSIRFMQYIDTTAGSGDEVCTIFASNGVPADRDNYAVCIDQVGTDRVSIARDVKDTELSGTILGTANFSSLTTGWYEVLIDWETDDSIDVVVRQDSTGTVVATTTATDSTYSSGGIGFAYWFQNGGWDSFVAWPRTETVPTVLFGDEQSDGGATWAGAQNTPTGGFAFGDTARLRVAIENSGLPIVSQRFRLEYAPKLTAPSCEAVSVGDFNPVPNIATCGSDAVCMTTSANVSDNGVTTDHLVTDGGDFVAGKIVTSPNNRTASYDLGQDLYTEIEYALNLTVNATNDAYCFRVTDDGASLDSYSNLPELTLAFDPVITNVTLNDGLDISLVPGTTTTIIASSTVTDFNGVGDLASATTTFYTTSAGALCTPNDNNCYVATSSCSFTSCTGTSCSLQCSAPFAFHANPTDDVGDPDEWFAFMEVSDTAGGVDLEGSIGVELFTIRALDVQNDIAYGSVDINDDTGAFNPMVSLVNIGNEPIDVTIGGTDMTDGGASVIPAAQQLFATSTFTYTSCIGCQALSVIGTDVEVDLPKPVASTPAVADEIYWGIEVPFGTNSASHTGLNSFTAISD